jgi:hypothetical protein
VAAHGYAAPFAAPAITPHEATISPKWLVARSTISCPARESSTGVSQLS